MVLSIPDAQFFITDNVLEDSVGSYTMTQNNGTNLVTSASETIKGNAVIAAYFSSAGTNNGSNNDATSPNGDHPNLYRSSLIIGKPTNFSVTYWVKTTGANYADEFQGHVYERGTWHGYCQTYQRRGTTDNYEFRYGDTNYNCSWVPDFNPENIWVHVGVRKVGSTLYLYVNGELKETTTNNSVGSASATQFRLGVTRDGAQCMKGYMHDVRVWKDSDIGFDGILDSYGTYRAHNYEKTFDGLVAGYDFKKDAKDFSGNGNDGVVSGATLTTDRFGVSDGCYSFDAKNEYISIPAQNSSILSVSMWYYYDGVGDNWNTLLCRAGSAYHHLLIQSDGTGSIGFYNSSFYDSGYNLVQGNWYHLVLVKDGTNSKLYINTSLEQDSNSSFNNSTYPLALIGNYGSYTQGALGKIDNVLIYNKALTADEIQTLYDLTSKGKIYPYPQSRKGGITE